ncbi:MAG: hypothetical protein AAGK14_04035 [Verrucomicrobiota bacterium]
MRLFPIYGREFRRDGTLWVLAAALLLYGLFWLYVGWGFSMTRYLYDTRPDGSKVLIGTVDNSYPFKLYLYLFGAYFVFWSALALQSSRWVWWQTTVSLLAWIGVLGWFGFRLYVEEIYMTIFHPGSPHGYLHDSTWTAVYLIQIGVIFCFLLWWLRRRRMYGISAEI